MVLFFKIIFSMRGYKGSFKKLRKSMKSLLEHFKTLLFSPPFYDTSPLPTPFKLSNEKYFWYFFKASLTQSIVQCY